MESSHTIILRVGKRVRHRNGQGGTPLTTVVRTVQITRSCYSPAVMYFVNVLHPIPNPPRYFDNFGRFTLYLSTSFTKGVSVNIDSRQDPEWRLHRGQVREGGWKRRIRNRRRPFCYRPLRVNISLTVETYIVFENIVSQDNCNMWEVPYMTEQWVNSYLYTHQWFSVPNRKLYTYSLLYIRRQDRTDTNDTSFQCREVWWDISVIIKRSETRNQVKGKKRFNICCLWN